MIRRRALNFTRGASVLLCVVMAVGWYLSFTKEPKTLNWRFLWTWESGEHREQVGLTDGVVFWSHSKQALKRFRTSYKHLPGFEDIVSTDWPYFDEWPTDQPVHRIRTISVHFGLLFVSSACALAVSFTPMLYRRRFRGGCLACGYNLTGNTSGVCPECGMVIPERKVIG